MAVYIVTGTLGSGKSLTVMNRMREALWSNKRVATNVNVRIEHLASGKHPRKILRIPDHPTAKDLWDLGFGSTSKNEADNGCLVIDEVGTWLNSRSWKDGDRNKVIEWFIHSRKRKWDVYLIAQSINMIDKQVREAIGEHVVTCKRYDRMSIPMVGTLFNWIGLGAKLPQIHVAVVRYTAGGSSLNAPIVDRWIFNGKDLWGCYDTAQRFEAANDGCASFLSPDRYRWLAKPSGKVLKLKEWAELRNHHRIFKLLDWLRPWSEDEKGYRLLQLQDLLGPFLTKPVSAQNYDEWFRAKVSTYRSRVKWGALMRLTPAHLGHLWRSPVALTSA